MFGTLRQSHGGGVVNRRIVLKKNPEGEPKPSDFEVVTEEVPAIAEGQMLLRTKWLTLDPYMRGLDASGLMNNERSLGSTIVGGTVSEVVVSRACSPLQGSDHFAATIDDLW